jgi:hypothetical protein
MGVHENKESWKGMVGIRCRLLPGPFGLSCILGTVLIFLVALFFGLSLFRGSRAENSGYRFPPGVLADYVPEDSAAVIGVNFRQLVESPSGQRLRSSLQRLLVHSGQQLPWLESIGTNPLDDIDTLFLSFPAGGGGEPVLLARGRFDPSRFQVGPGMLKEASLDHVRVWEYQDRPAKQTTVIAAVGDTLVVSQTRSRVQSALKQASDPQPVSVRDPRLREMLTKVDRNQSLWLAASVKELGPVSGIDNYLLRMILRPLLAHAGSVYGGIACADDIRADLHFGTETAEDADHLEKDLTSLCESAAGVAFLDRQGMLQPLLRLLAAGQIRREGKTILLYCRLRAEQLEK